MRAPATLHLTNCWHSASGGIRTFYDALLRQAAVDGRRLTVVVPGPRDDVVSYGGDAVLRMLRAPCSPVIDRRYRVLLPHRYLPPGMGPLWALLRAERPDVVEVSDKFSLVHFAGLIKRRSGPRPTVVGFSQERLDDNLRAHVGDSRAGRAFARWYLSGVYLRQFDAHVANSAYTAQELLDVIDHFGPASPLLWRLRPRVSVMPLGVSLQGFDPRLRSSVFRADVLRRAGGTTTSSLIVYAGRLSREKHTSWLPEALAHLVRAGVDARLAVAGDGPERTAMTDVVARVCPGRLAMLGHLPPADLARLLASADVFLHPNPREPFGIGPLEAMASGLPLIVPRQGGVLTFATSSNAWLADPSPGGLAATVREALQAPDEARARAALALKDVRAFDWPQVARRHFNHYDAIHRERLARVAATSRSETATPLIVS